MKTKQIVVGILGGMGPAATGYFFNTLIQYVDADSDQEHPRIIIDNNPKIPDRTDYILNRGPNPVPELCETAQNIENAGADVLAVPCNTSHAFINQVRSAVSINVLDMINLTVERISTTYKDIQTIGLLATTGTIESKLYHEHFSHTKFDISTPSRRGQDNVMSAIYGKQGIKAGYHEKPKKKLMDIVQSEFYEADIILSGCTEISMIMSGDAFDTNYIDPLTVLAEDIIKSI